MMPEEKLPNPTDLKRSQGWDILLNKKRIGEVGEGMFFSIILANPSDKTR